MLGAQQAWMDRSDRLDIAAGRRRHAMCRCLQRCRECAQLCRQLADECCRAQGSAEYRSVIGSSRLCAGVCDDLACALSNSDRLIEDIGPMLDSAVNVSVECGDECDELGDICIVGPRCGEACRRLAVACLGLISALD